MGNRRRRSVPRNEQAKLATHQSSGTNDATNAPKLPRGALRSVNIGQSFAEYDPALKSSDVYVHTLALNAAQDADSGKVFFVGRRGTGKTAVRLYCGETFDHTRVIIPEIFSPTSVIVETEILNNTKARPFQSLVSAFRRSLQIELLMLYDAAHPARSELPKRVSEEIEEFGDLDFDLRSLRIIDRVLRPLGIGNEEQWLRENKAAREVADQMKQMNTTSRAQYTVIVDSIDDYWEGSDSGLIYLTAFMHACQEITAQIPWARTIMFLRENIFERVRSRDTESSRLETAVVGMEWSEAQLRELVERRLNRNLTAKVALDGPTLSAFFENSTSAWSEVLEHCQRRPRDVLIYVNNAVESAQAAGRERITDDDVAQARRRFSDNRLRDLGDEYAENFPNLSIVLERFYGLGNAYTLAGIEAVLQRLVADPEVTRLCGTWIFEHSTPERFIRLLYNIGFVGLRIGKGAPRFRALGPQDTTAPPVTTSTDIVVHKCYWDALDLQDVLVRDLPEGREFSKIGLIEDLPGGVSQVDYVDGLEFCLDQFDDIPKGHPGAADFEEIVGDVLRLCFFRSLANVEAKVRTSDGRSIRDWIVANRAQDGFWEHVRSKYGASQVTFECKNYAKLKAEDFHQAQYYMNDTAGRFTVLVFRGEIESSYLAHIRAIASSTKGMVLLLTEKDLKTFLRQAANGKVKEDHIQDRYDSLVRKL